LEGESLHGKGVIRFPLRVGIREGKFRNQIGF